MSSSNTYSRAGVSLHWISALLILSMWPIGKLMDDDAATSKLYTFHIWLGLLITVLTLARVVLHFRQVQPDTLDMPRWEAILFKANHVGLYLMAFLSCGSGVAMLVQAGSLPLPGTPAKPKLFDDLAPAEFHELPANLIMLLFLMHVAGVIFFQVTKGKTLRRMGVPIGD